MKKEITRYLIKIFLKKKRILKSKRNIDCNKGLTNPKYSSLIAEKKGTVGKKIEFDYNNLKINRLNRLNYSLFDKFMTNKLKYFFKKFFIQ